MPAGSVLGSALALPFATGSADICLSSNVLEHVPQPERMADEMVRVTRPGGIVYLSYTNWLSPWGGHETSPWHYLGGDRAARRYQRRMGKAPKNRFGESLYAVSVAQAMRWARSNPQVDIVAMTPRYHPSWAQWVVHLGCSPPTAAPGPPRPRRDSPNRFLGAFRWVPPRPALAAQVVPR